MEEEIPVTFSSKAMKGQLLKYFRFERGFSYIATECGANCADIGTITKAGNYVEVEVKISMADFRADFKKHKHIAYQAGKNFNHWTPHQFYFCVPYTLVDKAMTALLPYPKYGLLVMDKCKTIYVHKKAVMLHRDELKKDQMIHYFVNRMASELCSLYTKLEK